MVCNHQFTLIRRDGRWELVENSELRNVTKALQKALEQWEVTFNTTQDSIILIDPDFTILRANMATSDLLGKPLDDILGCKCYELFHGTTAAPDICPHKKVKETKKHEEAEIHIADKDIWIAVSVDPILDDNGNISGTVHVARNITEKKKMSEDLRNSREKMRSFLELSPDFITIVDPDHTIQFINRAASGQQVEKVIGKSAYEFIEPRYHEDIRKAFSQTFATGQSCSLVVRGIDSNGKLGWFENRLAPVKHNGSIVAVMAVSTDITKRRKAEEKLKQSREFLANTINALDDTFFVKDEEHRWTVLNDAACKAIGRPREELIGKSDYDLFPREQADVFWEKDNLVLKTGKTNISEEEVTWQGKLHTISTKKSLFTDYITGKRFIVGTARNVTERKRVQEALQESEQKYRALIEQSMHGIVILQDYRIVFANKAACEIPGLTMEELHNLSFKDMMTFIPPENRSTIQDRLKARFAGRDNVPQNYELRLLRKNGEEFWLNLFFSPIKFQGRPAIQLAFTDITENKRMEESLRLSEASYRELADSITDIFFAMDKNLRYTYWNKASEKLTGISAEDAIGKPIFDIFPDAEATRKAAGVYQEVLKTQQPQSFMNDYQLQGKDFSFEINAYPSRQGLSVFAKDITERKKAEEALTESEEKFRNLAEQSPNMIFINKRGRVLYANKKCEEVMGYKREEFYHPDFDFMTLIAPEFIPLIKTNFSRHLKGEDVKPYEYGLITKDGERLDAIITSKLMKYDGESSILGTITDITERKQAEEKLHEYQEQLQSLASQLTLAEERERRRIATELHDEISQSLFISKMKLEALHKSPFDKDCNETLDEINNSLGRILASMRSLTFDLSSPILYEFGFEEAVSEWLAEQIEGKYGIETEFQDDGLPKPLDDDIRVLLFRNVRELLINVVKHARAKKIKVSIQKVDSRISICIEDDGVGFDSAKAESLITNKKAFGLFSIRERLEHLGGNLDIESSPGCGCRITITSPLN